MGSVGTSWTLSSSIVSHHAFYLLVSLRYHTIFQPPTLRTLHYPALPTKPFVSPGSMALEPQKKNSLTNLFEFKLDMRDAWHRGPTEMLLRNWEPYNQARIAADSRIFVHRVVPEHALPLAITRSICNKLSILYWSYNAQIKHDDGSRSCSKGPGAAVWKEWLRCNAGPELDLGFYFANPFRMDRTAPKTISELLVLY